MTRPRTPPTDPTPSPSGSRLRDFQVICATITGMAIIAADIWRDSWDYKGLALAGACLGAITADGLTRLLLERLR